MEEATAGLLRDKRVEAAETLEAGIASESMRRRLTIVMALMHIETILRLADIFYTPWCSKLGGGSNSCSMHGLTGHKCFISKFLRAASPPCHVSQAIAKQVRSGLIFNSLNFREHCLFGGLIVRGSLPQARQSAQDESGILPAGMTCESRFVSASISGNESRERSRRSCDCAMVLRE